MIFFFFGREYSDYLFGMLSGIIFFVYGVALLITPMPVVDSLTNLVVACVMWAAGTYIMLRASYELIKNE